MKAEPEAELEESISLSKPQADSDSKSAIASANSTLQASLSVFSYSPTPTPARRSTRFARIHEKKCRVSESPSKKRAHLEPDSGSELATPRSPKKAKRGYAPPETYAHLHVLQDYLKDELDIMFCGINPGFKSAQVGHHFANPTNHFWRCLYRSGFTLSQLAPAEDHTLPDAYCLGLTNLVDRPSAEQAELSTQEMAASVPGFLQKVTKYRPRIVCFVGVGIWNIVKKELAKLAAVNPDPTATLPKTKGKKGKEKKGKASATLYGLQPYKLVYATGNDSYTSVVRETYFFTCSSTSGRVVHHQLDDKVKLFTTLKKQSDDLKNGIYPNGDMDVVHI